MAETKKKPVLKKEEPKKAVPIKKTNQAAAKPISSKPKKLFLPVVLSHPGNHHL